MLHPEALSGPTERKYQRVLLKQCGFNLRGVRPFKTTTQFLTREDAVPPLQQHRGLFLFMNLFSLCLLISLHPTLVVRIAFTQPLLIDSNTAQCVGERWSTETHLTLMKRHSHTRRKPKSNMAATINIRQPERKKCQLPQSKAGR